jgi:nicotinamidase-related amidase
VVGTPETGMPAAMADTALLVVDMHNAYRHPDADALAANVAEIVER